MNSLIELNSFTADQFEDWLRRRLIDQHSPDRELRWRAFDFRALGLDRGESYIDDVVALAERLNADTQRNFGVAIEQLLQHAQPGEFPGNAMADLIRIAGDVRAFNALARIGQIVGSTSWGELKPSLVYDALAVMMKFEASLKVYSSVRTLATSRHFQDGYAIDAYLQLIRCCPENWLDDLMKLQPRMTRYRRHIEASRNPVEISRLDAKESSMALKLAKIPLSPLAQQLARVNLAVPFCIRLLQNLFGLAGPLILRDNDKLTHWLVEDDFDPARCAPLECDDARLLSRFQNFCFDASLVVVENSFIEANEYAPDNQVTASTATGFFRSEPNAELFRDACQPWL